MFPLATYGCTEATLLFSRELQYSARACEYPHAHPVPLTQGNSRKGDTPATLGKIGSEAGSK